MVRVIAMAGAFSALSGWAGPPEERSTERLGDAYVRPERLELTPPSQPMMGEFVNVQVNTVNGLNVVDDAANEPSIGVDPTAPNRIGVGWRQFDTVASSFRQAGYSWSVDGGRTWASSAVIEPGVFRSDPVLGAGADGTLYYLSLTTTPFFFTDLFVSHDGGATWGEKHFAYGGDKAWLAVDPADGTKLYQSWSTAENSYAPAQFNRSLGEPIAWEEPVAYADPPTVHPSRGTLAVGVQGEVYSAGSPTPGSSSFIQVVRSEDAQDPFMSEPTFVESVIEPGGGVFYVGGGGPNPGGLLNQIDVGVDASDGPFHASVYVLGLWLDDTGSHIGVTRSDDAGMTWGALAFASDEVGAPGNVPIRWFGTLSVAPNGRVDVVFNDNRDAPDGEQNLTRTYYTYSIDGGETWSRDVPLGPTWDSHVGWPNQQKIGDYYDMRSDLVGADLIYAATYNGEQDVYYVRIGDRDCNANGVGDEIDLADGTSADCNRNGMPDECEIAAGTLHDVDGDGVPDECLCLADINGDGEANILDFVAFQRAWVAGESSGDCDANGRFDVLDFVCFQTLFVRGCT